MYIKKHRERFCFNCGKQIPQETDNEKHYGTCPFCGEGSDFVLKDEDLRTLEADEEKRRIKEQNIVAYNVISISDSGKKHVNCPNLAKLIAKEHDFKFITVYDDSVNSRMLYYYKNGFYRMNGEHKIRPLINYYLGDLTTKHRKSEVVDYINDMNSVHRRKMGADIDLINCRNGVLNFRTGEFTKHDCKYMFINRIPVDYKEGATCPHVEKFMAEVFPDKYNIYIPVIQEMFGFCLYRKYILHVAFMLYGGGRNGKTVCLDLLAALIGNGNFSNRALHELMEDKFAKADLYGRMANICGDISDKALKNTDSFKRITGGDFLSGEKKFMSTFSFKNYAKLVFNANNIPYSSDKTDAFVSRWIIPVFSRTFKRGEKGTIPDLAAKILSHEDELSGLLNWSIIGLKRLLENNNFSYHDDKDENESRYESLRNPNFRFLNDYLEVSLGNQILKDDLLEVYKGWCEERLYPASSTNILTKNIKTFSKKEALPKRVSIDNKRVHVYSNLRWNSAHDELNNDANNIVQSDLMSLDEKRERYE